MNRYFCRRRDPEARAVVVDFDYGYPHIDTDAQCLAYAARQDQHCGTYLLMTTA